MKNVEIPLATAAGLGSANFFEFGDPKRVQQHKKAIREFLTPEIEKALRKAGNVNVRGKLQEAAEKQYDAREAEHF